MVYQNFGFDLENGITQVEFDLNEPHYYMEMRKISERQILRFCEVHIKLYFSMIKCKNEWYFRSAIRWKR